MKESYRKFVGSPIWWAGVMLSGGIAFVNAIMRAETVVGGLINFVLAFFYALISWFGVGIQLAGMIFEVIG